MDFTHINKRLATPRTDLPENQYEFWVNETAKLLKRPYMQVHLIFEREGWTMEKIRDRYYDVTKHCPTLTKPEIRWWALRKRENELAKTK